MSHYLAWAIINLVIWFVTNVASISKKRFGLIRISIFCFKVWLVFVLFNWNFIYWRWFLLLQLLLKKLDFSTTFPSNALVLVVCTYHINPPTFHSTMNFYWLVGPNFSGDFVHLQCFLHKSLLLPCITKEYFASCLWWKFEDMATILFWKKLWANYHLSCAA